MPSRRVLARLAVAVSIALGAVAASFSLTPAAPARADVCGAVAARDCPIVNGETDPGGVTLTATAPPAPGHPSPAPSRASHPIARPRASDAPTRPAAAPRPRSTGSPRPPAHRPAHAPAQPGPLFRTVCEAPSVVCGAPRTRRVPAPAVPAPAVRVPAMRLQRPVGGAQAGAPTLVDVARVAGEASAAQMQPDGWAVAGAPAGFLADGAPKAREVMLLGRPATVRLTPTAYHWTFSDGARLDTSDPGVRWSAAGGGPFTVGPTTHVFAVAGRQQAALVTQYRAEYRYAGGEWRSVPGTLSLAALPLQFTVLQAKTVLVAQDCSENAAGPGCPSR